MRLAAAEAAAAREGQRADGLEEEMGRARVAAEREALRARAQIEAETEARLTSEAKLLSVERQLAAAYEAEAHRAQVPQRSPEATPSLPESAQQAARRHEGRTTEAVEAAGAPRREAEVAAELQASRSELQATQSQLQASQSELQARSREIDNLRDELKTVKAEAARVEAARAEAARAEVARAEVARAEEAPVQDSTGGERRLSTPAQLLGQSLGHFDVRAFVDSIVSDDRLRAALQAKEEEGRARER